MIAHGSLTTPAKGIAKPRVSYRLVPGFIDRISFAVSTLERRYVAKAGVEMLSVVPVHEFGIPLPRLLERREESGIVDRVFQCLMPGFDEGIVIAAARP